MTDDMLFYRSAWATITAPRWKVWLAKLLGTRFEGRDGRCTVVGYRWRGIAYMTNFRHDGD